MQSLRMLDTSQVGVAAFVVVTAAWFVFRIFSRQQDSLNHIPLLKFDENDTYGRYVTESQSLLHAGYLKYSKKGIAFRMHNPVDPDHPQIILPFTYLDEVKNVPESRLSFPLFSKQAFLLEYTNGPLQTDAAAHIVRGDLNKNLGSLLKIMHDECVSALQGKMPKCDEWTPVSLYMIVAYTIARISSRVLVGPQLCRNEEWLEMAIGTTIAAMKATVTIRASYARRWRWLAPFFSAEAKMALANRKRAAQLLLPIYNERMSGTVEKGNDGIQWLLDAEQGRKKSVEELADEQLFLGITSIHSSAASTLSILYDLLDHPEYLADLLEEIDGALKESQHWTKQSLGKLEKLDSFMKESQRVNPMGMVTVQRSAVEPYTFKDGTRIPANTQCCFPNYELNHDPDVYTDPGTFDGYRFLKLRQQKDPNKYHFAFVSEDSINFGAGTHACPGRFFASHELKLILVNLLLHYEMKWPPGKSRPPNMVHDFSRTPDPSAEIMFKGRKL